VLDDIDLGNGEHLSAQVYGLGASLGMALRVTRSLEVVPFASAALFTQVSRMRFPSGPEAGWTDHSRSLSLGAGLVFGKVVTIRPSATFTVAEAQPTTATTSYGLRFSSSFGRVARRAPLGAEEGSLDTVWMDRRTGMYYCRGSKTFGATPYGTFVTEREALAAGASPEYGRRC
jgi:hypothetical protein